MLKERANFFRRMMIVFDMGLVAGAFLIAYALRNAHGELGPLNEYLWFLITLVVVWGGFLYFSNMYHSFRLKKTIQILFLIFQSGFLSFFVFAGLCFLFKIDHISRLFVTIVFCLAALFIAIEKIVLIRVFRVIRQKGYNYRNFLLVGTGERAQRFMRIFNQNRDFGLNISGLIDDSKEKVGQIINGHKVLGTLDDIPQIVREQAIDQVFFVTPRSWMDKIEKPILYLETVGIKVDLALDYFNLRIAKSKQTDMFGIPILSFESTPDKLVPFLIKRIFDIGVSLIMLILLAPLFLAIAILIKRTSSGPVFFAQERSSLNGRTFVLYKFRTMHEDAEERRAELEAYNQMKGPAFKLDNDPRITPLGAFMRKFSIDELPQLYNVFKGDMSLVGPRPPIVDEVRAYDDWQRRKLSMRPGLTCLWQVNGRSKITDFNQWAKLDLEYIDNWSLWLDFKILLKTIPVVLIGHGSK